LESNPGLGSPGKSSDELDFDVDSALPPPPPDPGWIAIKRRVVTLLVQQQPHHNTTLLLIPRTTMEKQSIVKAAERSGAGDSVTDKYSASTLIANTADTPSGPIPAPAPPVAIITRGGSGLAPAGADGPSWRRDGKQPATDERTEVERTPLIVNLAEARGRAPARLVAVGVFLSVIAITSSKLVGYMRNVWRIRGPLESLQLADGRFVLEFSSVGDFEHVTRGGPWRYQGDAVLVRKLKVGEDPNTVTFQSMPIWVQFTCIPFYLLSKQLARNLARKIGDGEYICIDNNARGDICDKILRAKVDLPIAKALQRWITLEDEFSNEEVIVSVLYERLPTFCLYCGVIGHQEGTCDLPAELRKRRYKNDIGVPATHVEDKRKWYLAETAGENGRGLQMDIPWRNVAALGARRALPPPVPLELVAHVANEVEKLSVLETGTATKETIKADNNSKLHATPSAFSVEPKTANNNAHAATSDATSNKAPREADEGRNKKGSWKRVNKLHGEALTASGPVRDSVAASDNKLIEQDKTLPSRQMGTNLGKRDGHELNENNYNLPQHMKKLKGEGAATTDAVEDDPGNEDREEATSPGATGHLTGANDRACQKP
jgi:hypothetical protein